MTMAPLHFNLPGEKETYNLLAVKSPLGRIQLHASKAKGPSNIAKDLET